ncbi:hypothetical protein BDN70DRAFT_886521 [Pholiota conissans]|uniref:Uncharacterized protein n=1 Tax=Pholiota conissans TaxID=109636 RepID=A0A9P5YPR5_9AGAR|nr:hypothetical protein BDN70DRAFT_886521 [Pholiota conissans]
MTLDSHEAHNYPRVAVTITHPPSVVDQCGSCKETASHSLSPCSFKYSPCLELTAGLAALRVSLSFFHPLIHPSILTRSVNRLGCIALHLNPACLGYTRPRAPLILVWLGPKMVMSHLQSLVAITHVRTSTSTAPSPASSAKGVHHHHHYHLPHAIIADRMFSSLGTSKRKHHTLSLLSLSSVSSSKTALASEAPTPTGLESTTTPAPTPKPRRIVRRRLRMDGSASSSASVSSTHASPVSQQQVNSDKDISHTDGSNVNAAAGDAASDIATDSDDDVTLVGADLLNLDTLWPKALATAAIGLGDEDVKQPTPTTLAKDAEHKPTPLSLASDVTATANRTLTISRKILEHISEFTGSAPTSPNPEHHHQGRLPKIAGRPQVQGDCDGDCDCDCDNTSRENSKNDPRNDDNDHGSQIASRRRCSDDDCETSDCVASRSSHSHSHCSNPHAHCPPPSSSSPRPPAHTPHEPHPHTTPSHPQPPRQKQLPNGHIEYEYDFEMEVEPRAIVCLTPLSPPPWHRLRRMGQRDSSDARLVKDERALSLSSSSPSSSTSSGLTS